jgi:hypothetical protein
MGLPWGRSGTLAPILCSILGFTLVSGSAAPLDQLARQPAPQCVRCVSGTSGVCQGSDGVCWPSDVTGSCPSRTFACTCPVCLGTTSGPCHFDDGSCGGYAEGTLLCPGGSWECHSGAPNAPTPSNSPTPNAVPTAAAELKFDSGGNSSGTWTSGMSFMVAGIILVGAALTGSTLYAVYKCKQKPAKDGASAFSGDQTARKEKVDEGIDLEHGARAKSEAFRGA